MLSQVCERCLKYVNVVSSIWTLSHIEWTLSRIEWTLSRIEWTLSQVFERCLILNERCLISNERCLISNESCLILNEPCLKSMNITVTTLIVLCLTSLLILIIQYKPFVYFKLIWSIHLLLAFCLLIPILSVSFSVRRCMQRKLSFKREILTTNCNRFTSYVSYVLYPLLRYIASSENRVKVYGNILFQSAPDLESMLF